MVFADGLMPVMRHIDINKSLSAFGTTPKVKL